MVPYPVARTAPHECRIDTPPGAPQSAIPAPFTLSPRAARLAQICEPPLNTRPVPFPLFLRATSPAQGARSGVSLERQTVALRITYQSIGPVPFVMPSSHGNFSVTFSASFKGRL